jgi:pimeloyl-ACP methyl ester carboxylesterase
MHCFRLLLIGCLALSAGCADSLVLPENHDTILTRGLRRKMLNVNGKAVEVWITRSPGAVRKEPQDFVLFFVGKEDRVERWVQIVADGWGKRPVEVWGMNYPGSGGSQGPTRLAFVGPDALATYDAMRAEAGARRIFLHAGSFGTAVAMCVAARRPVAGLVLHNPPPLKQLILGRYGWWNLWLLAYPVSMHLPADLDSIANGARCRAPAVFVLSGADQVVPPKYHQLVVDAYAGPKRIIDVPGARHNDPLPRAAGEQLQRAMDWLLAGRFSH